MRAWCLSFHAAYACRHSGACCTAGWPIPAEPPVIDLVTRGALGAALPAGEAPLAYIRDGAFVAQRHGACVFFDGAHDGACTIHRAAGSRALPVACRNFPRVTLRDARGLFITLSHYCPTAARMLVEGLPIRIVEAPPSLSLDGEAIGLDASEVLPPLLRPGMLADAAGYSAWEEGCLATLDDPLLDAAAALAVIRQVTAAACAWSPGAMPLHEHVRHAFSAPRRVTPRDGPASRVAHAAKSFLAAHLFACWDTYQGGGLMAAVRAVERAFRALEGELARPSRAEDEGDRFVEAVRAVDFRLRHVKSDVGSGTVPSLRRG